MIGESYFDLLMKSFQQEYKFLHDITYVETMQHETTPTEQKPSSERVNGSDDDVFSFLFQQELKALKRIISMDKSSHFGPRLIQLSSLVRDFLQKFPKINDVVEGGPFEWYTHELGSPYNGHGVSSIPSHSEETLIRFRKDVWHLDVCLNADINRITEEVVTALLQELGRCTATLRYEDVRAFVVDRILWLTQYDQSQL